MSLSTEKLTHRSQPLKVVGLLRGVRARAVSLFLDQDRSYKRMLSLMRVSSSSSYVPPDPAAAQASSLPAGGCSPHQLLVG